MATLERPVDRGTRLGRAALARLGQELRDARIARGLSLGSVARAAGLSASELSRIERGLAPWVGFLTLSRCASLVGLDLSARLFPGGRQMRDAAQLGLLAALRRLVHPAVAWANEVTLPLPGDLRAWDATVARDGWCFGVEAESLPHDAQALARRLHLKLRDSGLDGVLLAVRDTRRTREFLRAEADLLMPEFPTSGRQALRALAAGESPGGSAIVLVHVPVNRGPLVAPPKGR